MAELPIVLLPVGVDDDALDACLAALDAGTPAGTRVWLADDAQAGPRGLAIIERWLARTPLRADYTRRPRRIGEVAVRCGITGLVVTYDQLGVLALLSLLPGSKAVQRYRQRLLAPLKEYDAAHRTSMLATLEVYLSTCCNAKRTAEKLFTHYTTVCYRIERIQEI